MVNLNEYKEKYFETKRIDTEVNSIKSSVISKEHMILNTKDKQNKKNINNDSKPKIKPASSSLKQQKKEQSLTKEDKALIIKIFGWSTSFVIITLAVFICHWTLVSYNVKLNSSSILVILYFAFGFEVAGVIIIFNLFFRTMSVQEYDNLKIIAEIERFIFGTKEKDEQPVICFEEFTKADVKTRFNDFVETK